ncbi:MAG: TraB/GumN family protein [Proteobacteria bacterium]|nr:TraB/GumN family protein [Pseudomonadota bacterium]
MFIGKTLFPLYLLLLFFSLPVYAGTSVWTVEKDGNRLFIGGTVHLLTASDYPLPPAFEKAYNGSVKVVLETDMQKLQSPEFQAIMMRELSYSDGRNLEQVVNQDTYAALEQFFSKRGIPMAGIIGFKPGMVSIMMTMVELQRLGLAGIGVDAYYSTKSINDQKKLGQLETVETQIAFIASMGAGQVDEMLIYTLADIERLPELMNSMKHAWRRGNLAQLKAVGITPFKNEFPDIYQALIVDRNNAWLPKIEAMVETSEVEFVLVGALHLAGDNGLLAQLVARGYRVRQLQAD